MRLLLLLLACCMCGSVYGEQVKSLKLHSGSIQQPIAAGKPAALACARDLLSAAAGGRRQDPLGVLAWINSEPLLRELLLGHIAAAPTTSNAGGRNGFSHRWHRHHHQHHRLGAHSHPLPAVPPQQQQQQQQQSPQQAQQQQQAQQSQLQGGSNRLTVQVDPNSSGTRSIPRGFLGLSHEWTGLSEMNPGYRKMLQDLTAYGDAPLVLRIGGGSTDRRAKDSSTPDVVPQATWTALRNLYSDLPGLVFLPGINLERLDPLLSREQLQAARANLPRGSIVSFELGNEPNYYTLGSHNKTTNSWLASSFVSDWRAMAQQLCCGRQADDGGCGGGAGGELAGPAWGHIFMRNSTLDWFLRVNHPCINLVTVHWYKATSQEHTTVVETLLDETPLKAAMASLESLVETSNRWGKPLRVAEMNSISNAGLLHVSNTLAAALWLLDGAFEAADVGAAGINLHQGDGTTIYSALWRTNSSAVRVKPPFYAMLLFKMAVRHGVSLLPWTTQTEDSARAQTLKVWALRDDSAALRFVLINKAASEVGAVAIQLQQAAGYHRHGKLIRLIGPAGLASEWEVTLAGMRYQSNGSPVGTAAGEVVHSHLHKALAEYTVRLPAASAALLVIPATRLAVNVEQ